MDMGKRGGTHKGGQQVPHFEMHLLVEGGKMLLVQQMAGKWANMLLTL